MSKILVLFLIYSLSGTALHFLYQLSKKNIVVGIFAAVNESVWEHIKILFTPIFIMSFINSIINKEVNFYVLAVELSLGMLLIILFYEIKVFIFKDRYGILNIISFYIISFIISVIHFELQSVNISSFINSISLIPIIIMFIMYLTFSIFPPKHKYFKDPITGTYGIQRHVN